MIALVLHSLSYYILSYKYALYSNLMILRPSLRLSWNYVLLINNGFLASNSQTFKSKYKFKLITPQATDEENIFQLIFKVKFNWKYFTQVWTLKSWEIKVKKQTIFLGLKFENDIF